MLVNKMRELSRDFVFKYIKVTAKDSIQFTPEWCVSSDHGISKYPWCPKGVF